MIKGKELVEAGYKLIPISRVSKMPTMSFAGRDTTEAALIGEEVGGRTAIRLPMMMALDIDTTEGHPGSRVEEANKFIKWLRKTGIFTEGDMWQATDSRGYHIVYKVPEGLIPPGYKMQAKKLSPEVDLKVGVNSYIINYGRFNTLTPREMPRQLAYALFEMGGIIKKPERMNRRTGTLMDVEMEQARMIAEQTILSAVPGERNNKLSNAIYKALFYDGVDIEEIEDVFYSAGLAIGLDEEEITASINHTIEKLGV